jgi:hypothetical protein
MKEEEELTNRSSYLVLVIILSASIICVISLDHQQLAYAKDNNNEGENNTRITLDSGLPIPIDLPDSMLSKLRTFCENSSSYNYLQCGHESHTKMMAKMRCSWGHD